MSAVMPTYGRIEIAFERGEGPYLIATDGRRYLDFATGIAVAFPRSPMVTASTAWEIAQNTGGRFRLGLGSQVKGHVVRRYSSEFAPPGPRMRDYVLAVRACLRAFRREEPLSYEGEFYKLSYLPARAAGFRNRGALLEGWPADVVVYDLTRLRRVPEWWDSEIAHDFPGGEWRRVQHAQGYRHILVNGEETFVDGECTGATPGSLLRHGRG